VSEILAVEVLFLIDSNLRHDLKKNNRIDNLILDSDDQTAKYVLWSFFRIHHLQASNSSTEF